MKTRTDMPWRRRVWRGAALALGLVAAAPLAAAAEEAASRGRLMLSLETGEKMEFSVPADGAAWWEKGAERFVRIHAFSAPQGGGNGPGLALPRRSRLMVVLRLKPQGPARAWLVSLARATDPLHPLAARGEAITALRPAVLPLRGAVRFSFRARLARAMVDRRGRLTFPARPGRTLRAEVRFEGFLAPMHIPAPSHGRKPASRR